MAGRLKDHIKAFFAPVVVSIKDGPLKGRKWSLVAGSNFVRGTFEVFKTKAVVTHLKPGDVVYDVGAHVGYYSAVSSQAVGLGGRVFSFEPRPDNIRMFERHMIINGFINVTLTRTAVGRTSGKARFNTRTGTGTGHLSESGDLEIPLISLDDWIRAEKPPPPDFLKIDVEGGEIGVLEGAETLIAGTKPIILIATHGEKEDAFVSAFLDRHGYRHHALDHEGGRGDTEILALPRA